MKAIEDIIAIDAIEVAYLEMTAEKITNENNLRLQQAAKDFIQNAPHFAKAYVRLGWLQMNNKEYAEAEKNFMRGLEIDPDYGIGYYNYLYFLVEIDRFEEAEAFIPVCLKVRSINTRLIYEEWDCLLEQTGRIEETIQVRKARVANIFELDVLHAIEDEIITLKNKIK